MFFILSIGSLLVFIFKRFCNIKSTYLEVNNLFECQKVRYY